MLQPARPHLLVARCFSESFRAYASNFPVLLAGLIVANLFGFMSLTILLGAFYAGYMLLVREAMESGAPRFKTIFSQLPNFLRYFYAPWVLLIGFVLGVVLPMVVIAMSDSDVRGLAQSEAFEAFARSLMDEQTWTRLVYLLGFAPDVTWLVGPAVGVMLLVPVTALIVGVRSFYVIILAADRNLPILDAYVESRNAVNKYGFWRHLALIALSWLFIGLINEIEGETTSGLLSLLAFPVSIGVFVSAYRQTLDVEARNRELFVRQYHEMRDELQTAHDMQMALLPDRGPELPGYQIAGLCEPANNVGGDYFAYRWLDDEETRLAIVVADVSGKAMEAAVTAVRFNEILRYEISGRTDPIEILAGLDDSLQGQIDETTFVTCCIGILHVPTGEVHVASAGHCPPFVYRAATDSVAPVNLTGYPLGLSPVIRPADPYQTTHLTLAPGDTLCLYSDGVVEARNAVGDFYEDDRLARGVATMGKSTRLEDTVRIVQERVHQFIGNAPRTDDITIVALKRDPAPIPHPARMGHGARG